MRPSRRLRSRMRGCEACELLHREGSASLVSISESSRRMRAGSKILPQVAHLVAHGSIGELEIVQIHEICSGPDLIGTLSARRVLKAHATNPIESMAHAQAKTSPWRV